MNGVVRVAPRAAERRAGILPDVKRLSAPDPCTTPSGELATPRQMWDTFSTTQFSDLHDTLPELWSNPLLERNANSGSSVLHFFTASAAGVERYAPA